MAAAHAWVVLVVDDEPQVREITRMVLKPLRFEGRGIEVLEAASAKEAREVFARRDDVAVLLVDVAMETENAGLDLVRHVRGELGNRFVRIIVRTGHSGQAPERDVVRDYDINDYREKTELTSARLEGVVVNALRGYRDLMAVEEARAGLGQLRSSLQDAERSSRLQRALLAISDLAASNLDMTDLLRGVHVNIGTLIYAENFYIVWRDPERDSFRFLYFADVLDDEPYDPELDIPMRAREFSLTWHLLRAGKPLRGNREALQSQVTGPVRSLGPAARDWLGVPMARDGRVHGGVVVQSYRDDRHYTEDDSELLEFVADHILTALERKRSQEELERRVDERTIELQVEIVERQRGERLQAALFQLAQLATEDIDEEAFYRRVHGVVGGLINAGNFYVALLSTDRISLDFAYFVDRTECEHPSRLLGRGLTEHVLAEGRAARFDGERIRELVAQDRIDPDTVGSIPVCWLGVPLRVNEETIGLIVVQSYDPAVSYGPAEQELLGFVASQIANSLVRRRSAEALRRANAELEQRVAERTQELRREIEEREHAQNRLQHEVLHDGLTALPNRGYLRDRLERVLALVQRDRSLSCMLLFIDFDRFKLINDSLGHLVGDMVLKEFAARLLTCVRGPDVVARLSGDEFAILLENAPVPSTGIKVAQRVLAAMTQPMKHGQTEMVFSASIGIAIGDARYHHADELLRDADSAMYRAKHLGRGRFELFDETMQQAAVDILRLEAELRAALQQDQFQPYFQPIMKLADRRVVGYEALIRWNHPERGVLAPGAFLKVAEDSGIMGAIDWRMYELSFVAARQLLEGEMHLTINVAPRHFRRPEFPSRLLDLLGRAGLAPQRLQIEITEGSLIEHPEPVRTALQHLREEGVGASLDDFGTGYSSLSYLHTFLLQVLKIDRSFVSGLGGDGRSSVSVVAAVLALARALDMGVVAEGIETHNQCIALMTLGCDFGQGYLLGRPAPLSHWLGLRALGDPAVQGADDDPQSASEEANAGSPQRSECPPPSK